MPQGGRRGGCPGEAPVAALVGTAPRYTTCSHSTPTYSSATPRCCPAVTVSRRRSRPWSPPGPWPGIGTELLTAALAVGGADTRAWAHGDLPAARALAARLACLRRELPQLRRGLEELPAPPSHDDIELRTYAGPADDAGDPAREQRCFRLAPRAGWVDRRTDRRADRRGLVRPPPGCSWPSIAVSVAPTMRSPRVPLDQDPRRAVGGVYIVGVDPAAQGVASAASSPSPGCTTSRSGSPR